MIKEDLIGKKFGKLLVISSAPNKGCRTCWECLCDCGNHTTVTSTHLKTGHTLNRDIDKRNTTGFLGVTKLNKTYRAAIMIDGINYRKSGFNTPEEAYKWRLQKEKEMMTYQ